MAINAKHTPEELKEVLTYDPETGEITWKVTTSTRAKAGSPAGVWQTMQNGRDYLGVTYQGVKMAGARLAWALYHGEWPDRIVFYRNGDSTDLSIKNLKLADHRSDRVVSDDGKVKYRTTSGAVRHYGLLRNYGITHAEYQSMLEAQNGNCAICGKPEKAKIPGRKTVDGKTGVRDLSLDHDHVTGAVRELLCNACNHVLGEVQDNPAILRAAADYLERHSAKQPNPNSLDPKEGLMNNSAKAIYA